MQKSMLISKRNTLIAQAEPFTDELVVLPSEHLGSHRELESSTTTTGCE